MTCIHVITRAREWACGLAVHSTFPARKAILCNYYVTGNSGPDMIGLTEFLIKLEKFHFFPVALPFPILFTWHTPEINTQGYDGHEMFIAIQLCYFFLLLTEETCIGHNVYDLYIIEIRVDFILFCREDWTEVEILLDEKTNCVKCLILSNYKIKFHCNILAHMTYSVQ